MAKSRSRYPSRSDQRQQLEHCWLLECDIDPLILRLRWLEHQGQWPLVQALEQELLPLF